MHEPGEQSLVRLIVVQRRATTKAMAATLTLRSHSSLRGLRRVASSGRS